MLSSMDVSLKTSQTKSKEYLMSVLDSKWKSLTETPRNKSSKRFFGSFNKSIYTNNACKCGHRLRLLTVKKQGPNTGEFIRF